MAHLQIRWSAPEARKPYARPFGVSFFDDADQPLGGIAVSGADLLYYRQFKAAVLSLSGELFALEQVEQHQDQQRAWLDELESLLPAVGSLEVSARSDFDHERGRVFGFDIACDGERLATVDSATLLEYQELQAALAHQSGRLYRNREVESVNEPSRRALLWERSLRTVLARPDRSEAIAESWPWR